MSNVKIINLINLRFFGAALLATTAVHGLKPPLAKATSTELIRQLPAQLAPSEADLPIDNRALQNVSVPISTISKTYLAQATSTDVDGNSARRSILIRRLVFSFFLLFFVPLGIFYPLFLFYKMLLVKPEDEDSTLPDEYQLQNGSPSATTIPNKTELTKATVSKLQIAFTPPAQELRKELSRVSLLADENPKDNSVNLMHQAIEVLLEQGHWTHVSHSSTILPLNLVKPEFDSIYDRERYKFTTNQSASRVHNQNSAGYERNYSYVVVTLVFCTIHESPLFPTINTKEQLVVELKRLKKMQQDSVIKFELLWNPQQEENYISNDRLLIEYQEMNRLF